MLAQRMLRFSGSLLESKSSDSHLHHAPVLFFPPLTDVAVTKESSSPSFDPLRRDAEQSLMCDVPFQICGLVYRQWWLAWLCDFVVSNTCPSPTRRLAFAKLHP